MFTYATKKNRYGDEHIAVFANGSQIAEIKPSSYYGKNEYIVSATIGDDDRGDCLGTESYEKTIADPSMLISSGSALMALPGM